MQKKISFISSFIILLLISYSSKSQFFYRDIWTNQQLTKEFSIIKNENIRVVTVNSFDDDGEPSEGFLLERKIDKNFTKSETISRSFITGPSLLVSWYNDKGMITKNIDSSQSHLARSEYEYDNKGRILKITNFTKANDENGGISETHEYFYSTNGRPEKMLRKRNNVEISVVNFSTDEKGNVIEEQEVTKGKNGKRYLYYYDERNRLTDVVSYNERAKRLLPIYIFEYNQQNQIKQMLSTEDGLSNYYTWNYTYNDQRLRETEKCFSKEKRLMGTIRYQYK